jgi:four helix bundle protein
MTNSRVQSSELRAQDPATSTLVEALSSGASAKSYRNLKAWQRSIELSVSVYRLTGGFPREEIYGLTSQLRRCSVSVASNLAEGYGRASKGEFRQFVGMARGSVLELQTQLIIAKALGYGKESQLQKTEGLAEEVGKMTWALMQKL